MSGTESKYGSSGTLIIAPRKSPNTSAHMEHARVRFYHLQANQDVYRVKSENLKQEYDRQQML